jgi:hypothetical protein
MGIIFIETPEFVRKFDRLASQDEMVNLQKELIENPMRGLIVQGTGGSRKIRMRMPGRGKSGGARIIYYYVDLRGEIWLLDFYLKSEKDNLTSSEKLKLYSFIKEKIL